MLFVCTANITRSPVAEAMLRGVAAKSNEKWKVGSAGTKAVRGAAPNPIAAYIMHQRGIPINKHRSQSFTPKLLKRFYWILVMEQKHRDEIVKSNPKAADRVFTVREFGRETPQLVPDMPDPTSKELEDYNELFAILDEEILRVFKTLQNKVSDLSWKEE